MEVICSQEEQGKHAGAAQEPQDSSGHLEHEPQVPRLPGGHRARRHVITITSMANGGSEIAVTRIKGNNLVTSGHDSLTHYLTAHNTPPCIFFSFFLLCHFYASILIWMEALIQSYF